MKTRGVLLLMLFGLSLPASASDLSYNFVDVQWLNTDVDGVGDGSGFGLRATVAVHPSVHIVAEYGDVGSDADTTQWRLGAGYNRGFGNAMDGFAQLTWESLEIGTADDDGFGIKAGVRSRFTDTIELDGYVRYYNIGDFDSDTLLGFAGLWHFGNELCAGVDGEFGSELNTFSIFGRYNFSGF